MKFRITKDPVNHVLPFKLYKWAGEQIGVGRWEYQWSYPTQAAAHDAAIKMVCKPVERVVEEMEVI